VPLSLGSLAAGSQLTTCSEPGAGWETAAPVEVGIDGAKMQSAIDWATTRTSESFLVIRNGCLVGTDRLNPVTGALPWESFSMAKSVTSMLVGRAMELKILDLDDTVGEHLAEPYLSQADPAHQALTVHQLLTMTSGLHWNLFRDYDVMTPDRVADALDLDFDTPPGSTFEYHQSGVALLAKVIEDAVVEAGAGSDLQDFAQKELFGPIGIEAGSWMWQKDQAGNTPGFYGIRMTNGDFARLGQLMLREGRWDDGTGKPTQLLAKKYVKEAGAQSERNPCYGLLFWNNIGEKCVNPTVYSRDDRNHPQIPSGPRDMYMMEGMLEQRVYIIPSYDMVIVRLGIPGSREPDTRVSVFTAAVGEFEYELFRKLMPAVDPTWKDPGPYTGESAVPTLDPYSGLQWSVSHPEDIIAPWLLWQPAP
jgi:CubicO group peptidase (beta-lactamase class C family)